MRRLINLLALLMLLAGCASAGMVPINNVPRSSLATTAGVVRLEIIADIARVVWRPGSSGQVRVAWSIDGIFEMQELGDAARGELLHQLQPGTRAVQAQVFLPTAIPITLEARR